MFLDGCPKPRKQAPSDGFKKNFAGYGSPPQKPQEARFVTNL
jgi:hypothetical protein